MGVEPVSLIAGGLSVAAAAEASAARRVLEDIPRDGGGAMAAGTRTEAAEGPPTAPSSGHCARHEEKRALRLVAAGEELPEELPSQAHAVNNLYPSIAGARPTTTHTKDVSRVTLMPVYASRALLPPPLRAATPNPKGRFAPRSETRSQENPKGRFGRAQKSNAEFGCAHLFGQRGDELKVHALERRRHVCVAKRPLRMSSNANGEEGVRRRVRAVDTQRTTTLLLNHPGIGRCVFPLDVIYIYSCTARYVMVTVLFIQTGRCIIRGVHCAAETTTSCNPTPRGFSTRHVVSLPRK